MRVSEKLKTGRKRIPQRNSVLIEQGFAVVIISDPKTRRSRTIRVWCKRVRGKPKTILKILRGTVHFGHIQPANQPREKPYFFHALSNGMLYPSTDAPDDNDRHTNKHTYTFDSGRKRKVFSLPNGCHVGDDGAIFGER